MDRRPTLHGATTDIISKLLVIQQEKPALLDEWIATMCATNFGAGVETTSITITAFIYQILSHTGCQAKIQVELDQARKNGRLSYPPKLNEVKELKYFTACLNESMRLHHVLGMPLPRLVPEEGIELEGIHLPPGVCGLPVRYCNILIQPQVYGFDVPVGPEQEQGSVW